MFDMLPSPITVHFIIILLGATIQSSYIWKRTHIFNDMLTLSAEALLRVTLERKKMLGSKNLWSQPKVLKLITLALFADLE